MGIIVAYVCIPVLQAYSGIIQQTHWLSPNPGWDSNTPLTDCTDCMLHETGCANADSDYTLLRAHILNQ